MIHVCAVENLAVFHLMVDMSRMIKYLLLIRLSVPLK